MGLRFYRRIRICKGIHLNVSKSGVGISLGMRGASISTGPRGQYVHLGIPGTGIAYRQKISSTTSKTNSNETYLSDSDVRSCSYIQGSNLKIQIDNDGKELVYMEAPDGTTFVDEEMMRRVKRSEMYREMLEVTRKTKYDYIKKENDNCIYIYKSSPKLITVQDVIEERDNPSNITKKEYIIHEFSEPEPRETPFYDIARKWAEENVKTHFWNRKKKLHWETHHKMYELFEQAKEDWRKRREEYYINEQKVKEMKDKEYEDDYKLRVSEQAYIYDQILNPSEDYLINTVKDVLSQIELPVEFSIDYSVSNKKIELDIDLPEIEDFPQKTCSILSTGKLSIKPKSISELNKDYATGVTGLAFFFASTLFNISPAIDEISISGYTQRTSLKTGNIEDQYVYSVTFPRNKFAELNIEKIDPIQALTNFEYTMDITSKFELKTINVRDSENRKTDSTVQEEQTEYYTVDPALIEEENKGLEIKQTEENESSTDNNTIMESKSDSETTSNTESNQHFSCTPHQKETANKSINKTKNLVSLVLLVFLGIGIGFYILNYKSYYRTPNEVFINGKLVDHNFFISKTEEHDEDGFPLVNMSWYDVINFCNELSKKNNLACVYEINEDGTITADFTKPGYRLPTEKEWYWAACGAKKENPTNYSGAEKTTIENAAWYIENSSEKMQKVAQKESNRLGIYDMSGNVAEWCWDSIDDNYRIVCGGFYGNSEQYLELSKSITKHKPDTGEMYIGFRVARSFVKKNVGVEK